MPGYCAGFKKNNGKLLIISIIYKLPLIQNLS